MSTVLTCLEQKEKHGTRRQKVYANNFTSRVSEFVYQLTEQDHRVGQIWELEELELRSEVSETISKNNRKQKVLRQPWDAARLVCASSVNRFINTVESKWLTKYIADEPGMIHVCDGAEVAENLEQLGYRKVMSRS